MHTQYDARRSLEWKIHISAWTLLAASAFGIASLHLRIPGLSLQIALGLFVVFHLIGTVRFLGGEKEDRELSRSYRQKAVELLTGQDESGPGRASWLKRFSASSWPWIIAEIGTTVCLAVVVLMINDASKPSPDPTASLRGDSAALRSDVSALRGQYAELQKRLDQTTTELRRQSRRTGAGSRKRRRVNQP